MRQTITVDKFIRWTLIALAVITVGFIINALSGVLLPFFIAWLLAYLLYPIVKFVQYKLHVPGRALSIIITLVFVTAIFAGIFYFIVPPMINQVDRFMYIVNRYLHETTHSNNIATMVQKWIMENRTEIEKFLKSPDFTNAIKTAMPKLFSVIGQTASIVISVIASCITLLYMFFILLDYEILTQNWIKIFPKRARPFWAGLAQDVERELNNYIRTRIGFTLHGHTLLYRLYHHRLPNGYRYGNPYRNSQPCALPPHLCTHPRSFPLTAQGS